MPKEKSVVIDFAKEETVLQVFSHAPLLSSRLRQWNKIHIEHHHWRSHELPEHYHAQHTIVLLHANQPIDIERMVDGQFQRDSVTNGDTWVLGANVPHGSWSEAAAEFTILALEPTLLGHTAYEFLDPDRVEIIPTLPKLDPLVYQLGLALKTELETDRGNNRFYIESATTMLSAHLLRHYSTCPHRPLNYNGGLSERQLQQVLEYIHAHLAEDLSLQVMADLVEMSQYYFVRLFKQSMGLTPHKYVIQRRLDRAKQFLTQRKLSIAQISDRLGFSDPSQFTHFFHKNTGLSPSIYRHSK